MNVERKTKNATAMQTIHHDARTSVSHLALVSLCLAALVGCTPWQLAKRTLHTELQQFPRVTEGKLSNRQYAKWAKMEWSRYAAGHQGEAHSSHYVNGFVNGFKQFVYSGGNTEPPAMPPRKYWKIRYRNEAGRQAVQDWFNGYSHGAKTARDNGYRDRATVPSSLLLGYHSEEQPDDHTDNLIDDSSGHEPAPATEQAEPQHDASEAFGDESPDTLGAPPADDDENRFEDVNPDSDSPNNLLPIPGDSSAVEQVNFLDSMAGHATANAQLPASVKSLSASLRSDVINSFPENDLLGKAEIQPPAQNPQPLAMQNPAPLSTASRTVVDGGLKSEPQATANFDFELSIEPPTPPWSGQASESEGAIATPLLEPFEIPGDEVDGDASIEPSDKPSIGIKEVIEKQVTDAQPKMKSELVLVGAKDAADDSAWSTIKVDAAKVDAAKEENVLENDVEPEVTDADTGWLPRD